MAETGTSSLHHITQGSRLLGFVSVDSTVQGRARGGLRIAADLSEEEIRSDSRAMTLKYGLLGLPQGGAKAGIVGNGEAPASEKRRLLLEFARAAGPLLLDRRYIPDADLGTKAGDIRWMMEQIGARVAPRDWRENRSGHYTARSCVASAQALLERRGRSLQGCRVAIEGFGQVGSALARLLAQRGAIVAAISTSHGALHRAAGLDVEPLIARADRLGGRLVEGESGRIEREALLELPVDLLFPCARFHSIHSGNVGRVAAQAICAGANSPVSPPAERALAERGVTFPPDFVTNCGGVLGGTLEFAGMPFDRIGVFVERQLTGRVGDLLDRSERLGVTPRSLAEADALRRHARARSAVEHPGPLGRVQAVGLEVYRRRWLPRRLMSRVAPRYVARQMA
jgi:glutamate dehydrogenase/leucine dehydrogenase